MWLSDFDKEGTTEEQGHEEEVKALEDAGRAKRAADKDTVVEDFDPNEEINLDEIPF
jgi:hypothetical protein